MDDFYTLFNGEEYISFNDSIKIKKKYQNVYTLTKRNVFYFFFKKKRRFIRDFNNVIKLTNQSNVEYLERALIKNQNLLDNINGYPLDDNQRLAILREEDNTLLIAGAGSGKSLTIVGKIRYLIEEKLLEEQDILCISFTKDATNQLYHNLKNHYQYDINVFTFHKLALNILHENNKKYQISQPDTLEYIIDEFFNYLIFDNTTLLKIVAAFFDKEINAYGEIIQTKAFIQFKKIIAQFIHLFKANIYNGDILYDFLKKERNKKNYYLLLCIISIYTMYEQELASQGEIDFDDMILKATDCVKTVGMTRKYKYILIDEYQDSSLIRCQFIQEIIKISNAKLLAVGDDFQSIYRFTGSNLDLFLNFSEYFPNPDILYIYNTYRNSQQLIDIAGNFVMKNKRQIRKKLVSAKQIARPIKIIYYEEAKNIFKKLISFINSEYKKEILVLGRNNNDIYKVIDDEFKISGNIISYQELSFHYLTVHSSKGLEADNVIIINLENTFTGFPSKMEDHEIIKLIVKQQDQIPYEEERRLFYVALTRTKNNSYLFVPKNNSSLFVKELIRDYKDKLEFLSIK